MSKHEHYNYLRILGCCKSCCFRFLGYYNVECYQNIDQSLIKGGYEKEEVTDQPPEKRLKENTCIACLGLLQPAYIDHMVSQVQQCKKIKLYDSKTINCAVSLPINLHLRALAVWLGLIENFPSFYNKANQPDKPLKEVWKSLFGPKLAQALGVELSSSGLMITVHLNHDKNDEELETLKKLKPRTFEMRSQQHRKYNGEMMTRNFFDVTFNAQTVKYADFIKSCEFPPSVPENPLKMTDVEVLGDTLFLAGRYNKFSRVLSQTPWILDGKRIMEGSVQEIVVEPVLKIFKSDPGLLRFSSSGREDVDVRCLGLGRPFVLELPDCQVTDVSYDTLRELERAINTSKDLKVRDLQLVKREDLVHIKQGEETKSKQYRALCYCTGDLALNDDILSCLQQPEGFKIQQKTPIRVLHRRPLMTRERTIHKMEASLVAGRPSMFYLDMSTQAGTYVKELVHGDFGRTVPNVHAMLLESLKKMGEDKTINSSTHSYNGTENGLRSKTEFTIDILALDVTAIELDWPPSIDC